MADNFIQIGETRIKKSNIKNFGTSSEKIPEEPSVDGLLGALFAVVGWFLKSKDVPKKTHRQYVYVTTYQNDNYKFYEDNIDIPKVIKQLEQI